MWCNFEPSTYEEETINNAFCSNGLFKISPNDLPEHYPNVQSVLQNKKLLVAVDESLALLENENVSECNFLSFPAKIDCLGVSESGNLVICGLTDGSVQGIYIKGVPVFNLIINETDVEYNRTFIGIVKSNDSFFLMCKNGVVYKLTNVDENLLSESLVHNENEKTTTYTEDLAMNNTTLEVFTTRKIYEEMSCFFIDEIADGCELVIAGNSNSIHFITNEYQERIELNMNYEGAKSIISLGHLILVLTNSGHLLSISIYDREIEEILSANLVIDDLRILESNENETELLICTKVKSGISKKMQIIDFLTMDCKYELEMPDNVWLIKQPKCSLNIYYIQGNVNPKGSIESIEMKMISETEPSARLLKLIEKLHLNEAEEFAKQFDLSLQPVQEAKVRLILGQMKINTECVNEKFEYLLQILNQMTDKSFLVGIRYVEIPDRSLTRRFLEFLLQNINGNSVDNEFVVSSINEQILRLDTLKLIDPHECDMNWQKFVRHPNLLTKCMELFKTDMTKASLIWSRHTSSIVPILNTKSIIEMQNSIPIAEVTPGQITDWLKHFVPIVLTHHPEVLSFLTDWCMHMTKSFEFAKPKEWPKIGLEFVTDVQTILKNQIFLFRDLRMQYEANLDRILKLTIALQDLFVLNESFKITFHLADYLRHSEEETAFMLLKIVQQKFFKVLVNDFLAAIFLEKGLMLEPILIRYVNFLSSHRNSPFWQDRSKEAIDLINDEEEKLQCVLTVLKASPVPWSETANLFIEYGSHSTHPLAEQIFVEHKSQILKILKKKYSWPTDYQFQPYDYEKFARRIMFVQTNMAEMLEDLKNLLDVVDVKHVEDAGVAVIVKLAEIGEVDWIVGFVNDLPETVVKYILEVARNILLRRFDDKFCPFSDDEADNFIEVIKFCSMKLSKDEKDDLKVAKNVLTLRRYFEIQAFSTDFCDLTKTNEFLRLGIQKIIEKMANHQNDCINILWRDMEILTEALEIDFKDGLYKICKILDSVHVTAICCSKILEYFLGEEKINYTNFVILLIIQQLNYFESRFDDSDFDDPLSFPLAYVMLKESSDLNNFVQLSVIQELIKWVRIVSDHYRIDILNAFHGKTISDTNFTKIFAQFSNQEESIASLRLKRLSFPDFEVQTPTKIIATTENNESLIQLVGYGLQILVIEFGKNEHNLSGFIEFFTSKAENLSTIMEKFFALLDGPKKIRNYSDAFTVVQHIIRIQNKVKGKVIIPPNIVNDINRRALKQILSQKEPNYSDAIAVLYACDNRDEIIRHLEIVLVNSSQKVAFLTLLETHYNISGDVNRLSQVRESRRRYYYFTELCKFDPSLKSKRNLEFGSISNVLQQMQNKILDVKFLEDLSRNFDWNFQDVLIKQLITILSIQRLDMEIKEEIHGKEEVTVKNSVEDIMYLCQPYINAIKNYELLEMSLMQYMTEISAYFYELYICVIEILSKVNKLTKDMDIWKNILIFLKHKMTVRRKTDPPQGETDKFLQLYPDAGMLPKIAKYRIPFLQIVNEPLKVTLDTEISVNDYEKWLPLIKLKAQLNGFHMKLGSHIKLAIEDQEYFCMQAVKNSIDKYKVNAEKLKVANKWNLLPTNNAFLQSVLRIIQYIFEPEKVFKTLYFVANHAPEGADQVEAAYECYKYSFKHENSLKRNPKMEEIMRKIRRKYMIFKTQHILYLYGLGEDRLFNLIETPYELINALYSREYIMRPQKPDVNKIVRELSELHNLDMHGTQMGLLNKWLSLSTTNDDNESGNALEETYYEDFLENAMEVDQTEAADDFIVCAHYILNSWDKDAASGFLVGNLFPAEGAPSTAKQIQIYDCFSKLLSSDCVTNTDIFNQKKYILLRTVHFLKQLGYKFSLEKFGSDAVNKMDILRKVWQSHLGNAKGLEVICYICIGYDIWSAKIWNGVLKQMVRLNLQPQLAALVNLLTAKEPLLNTEGLKLAWEFLIKEPFKNANRARSFEQDATLSQSLILLQSCPLSARLNLAEIAASCIRINHIHMAAVLVVHSEGEMRENLAKTVIQHKTSNLKADILSLEKHGIASIITQNALKILKL